MTSRATIRRKTGQTAQDESTGEEVPVWLVVHTKVPFRLGGPNQGSPGHRKIRVGEGEFEQATRVGNLPADTSDLLDGDYIDITSGENAGRALRILEATWIDQSTARRVPVVEVDRPGEW